MTTLKISNVDKKYPNGVHALKGITLTIEQGMFGLLGPNGAGKSSLMNTIATLQKPDSGRISLGDIDAIVDPDGLRKTLGYMPQDFGVYPNTSAVDMLDYFARLKGFHDSKARRQHILELLEMVNLSDAKDRDVDTYSGGMRQRFGVAQALIGSPKLVIVDEPTAGLDPEERNRLQTILGEIGKSAIIILATHIVEDVANLCSNLAVQFSGEIIAEGPPQSLMDALSGKVWTKDIATVDLADYRKQHQVIATAPRFGETRIIVKSETQPDASFESKTPDLEDVYFASTTEARA